MHRDITHEFQNSYADSELKAARAYAAIRHPYLHTDRAKLEIWREDLAWRRWFWEHRYSEGKG